MGMKKSSVDTKDTLVVTRLTKEAKNRLRKIVETKGGTLASLVRYWIMERLATEK